MGLRNALAMFRASIEATPPGAPRPSTTLWYDPSGASPPVSWVPQTGEFETHWDWDAFTAYSIPGYWRGRMLISQAIGGMPLGAWRDLVEVTPTPQLLREPCPGEDRPNTVAAWVGDLLDHGNAIGLVTEVNAEGKPVALAPVPCANVEVGRGESGRVFYKIGEVRYSPSMVFHAKGVTMPGALRGFGILEAGLSTVDRLRSEAAYAAKAFKSGVPSGLLRVKDPDLQAGTDEDEPGYVTAKGIKKAWQASVATGDVAVLSELVDFTPLAWTPTDAQMVEARQLSLVDVANMFGLDPYWVGASQVSAPYQNVQQSALQLSRFALSFWIDVLEKQFSRMLPRGQEARFNRDTILRDDQATRIDVKLKMLAAAVIDRDEFRESEGMPARGRPLAPVTQLVADGDQNTNEEASG